MLHVWLFGSLPEADKESIFARNEEKYIQSQTPLLNLANNPFFGLLVILSTNKHEL